MGYACLSRAPTGNVRDVKPRGDFARCVPHRAQRVKTLVRQPNLLGGVETIVMVIVVAQSQPQSTSDVQEHARLSISIAQQD